MLQDQQIQDQMQQQASEHRQLQQQLSQELASRQVTEHALQVDRCPGHDCVDAHILSLIASMMTPFAWSGK